jgi:GT2 family glycosyltransferase
VREARQDRSSGAIDRRFGLQPNHEQRVNWIEAGRCWIRRLMRIRRFLDCGTARMAARLCQRYGASALLGFMMGKINPLGTYARWIRKHEPDADAVERQRAIRLVGAYRFSVVTPVWNTPGPFLRDMVESVLAQTYSEWELCLAHAPGHSAETATILKEYASRDARVRVVWLAENLGIAGNSNAALAIATGDFVAFLDHDDRLAPTALFEMARAIQSDTYVDVLYSDEDKIEENGRRRRDHHFKPGWSPQTLLGQNYITHLLVVRRELLNRIGGFRAGYDGSQDHDLVLRATGVAKAIIHVPRVLYHWRIHGDSVAQHAGAKAYAYEAGRRAVADQMERLKLAGTVEQGRVPGTYRCRPRLCRRPTISVVLRGQGRLSAQPDCWEGSWRDALEFIGIDTVPARHRGSTRIRWLASDSPRPAVRLNVAATAARGEFFLFVDSRLEPVNDDWIDELVSLGDRTGVGMAGGRITAADGSHLGGAYAVGVAGLVAVLHRGFDRRSPGYGCGLVAVRDVSAVSGSCMLVRRKTWERLGGFDPRYRAVLEDVDLCLRAREAGLSVIWTPDAELKADRGRKPGPNLDSRSCRADRRFFARRWQEYLRRGDPYYSPNLTRFWDDCSLAAA